MNIEQLIKEYEAKKKSLKEYDSYINSVREYKGYIFKEVKNLEKFKNECEWLKKLNNLKFYTSQIIDTYNDEIIIMEKIKGIAIKDEKSNQHLYNIGKLMADLHNISIKQSNIDWKEIMISEYRELRNIAKDIMDNKLFEITTKFLEDRLEKLNVTKLSIIHRDLRPENVIFSNGEYYLVDLESMCIGDRDYDFTRMWNLLNEKEIYQYNDFKNLMDGYKSINNSLKIVEEKWQLYNKFYAFRIYSKMLAGKINRDSKFENYLKSILMTKQDRVTEWIKRYNKES